MDPLIQAATYRQLLEGWIPAAKRYLYRLPGDPEACCYGTGTHNHWALQANNTAFTAHAVLAADPDTDRERTQAGAEELLDRSLGMLRFAMRGHLSGRGTCVDGKRWGHSWISALCLERMMHGIEAIDPWLTERDREEVRTVLCSEADWILEQHPVNAAVTGANNRPESNMWNGALLMRTAALFPGNPRGADYIEKGHRFLANAISVPADADADRLLAGKPLRDRHVGANFFDSYACNHHGYLNVGYIVITLSNAAMLHFFLRGRGLEAPESLYHHVADVWPLVKACSFPDGRLLRIGGDTRVRYCYCQDYAIPVWLMMRDLLGDDCAAFEAGWLDQVAAEQHANEDASFLAGRLATMEEVSPLYYTRLEGDKAGSLSMGAYWRRRFAEFAAVPPGSPVPALTEWHDAYHGACLVRGPRRAASWVWGAAELPQGLCLPPDASDMAEWKTNLAGRVTGLGMLTVPTVEHHSETSFPRGFATGGRVRLRTEKLYAEGEPDADIATVDLAFAALPDGVTAIGLQRARTPTRVFLREVKGLMLQIPNDVFCGFTRTYGTAGGELTLRGRDGERSLNHVQGGWLSVDGRLGVASLYGGSLAILHPAEARVPIKSYPWSAHAYVGGGFLFVDEVCITCAEEVAAYDADAVLFDLGFAVLADAGSGEAAAFAARNQEARRAIGDPDLRAVEVAAEDGQRYLLLANFGAAPLPCPDWVAQECWLPLGVNPGNPLAPGEARLHSR